MGTFLTLFILFLFIGTIVSVLRRPREIAYMEPELIDAPVGELLPDELVQPFGDACVTIAQSGVELYKDFLEVERLLSKDDGVSSMEAKDVFDGAGAMLEDIAGAIEGLSEEKDLPDEASWWMGHLMEQVELIGQVDGDDGRITGGTGGIAARGAIKSGLERTEDILYADAEFCSRMLDFDLAGWVKEELDKDRLKLFKRAVAAGEGRHDAHD
jgi:hypothetical protein